MIVSELIKALQLEQDKTREVRVYLVDHNEPYAVQDIDYSISDRLDLNITFGDKDLN